MKLDGKPFDPHGPSASMVKLRAELLRSPKDEVFSSRTLKARGYSEKTLTRAAIEFPEVSLTWGANKRAWGCPAAIKELKRRLLG